MNSFEVSRIAGVSRSTVSRVVNGYSNVPEGTRARVQAVIDKYGYSPNNAARNLAGKPSNVVGLFILDKGADNRNIICSSPFYSMFMAHIADKLQERGCHLLVSVVKSGEVMQAVKGIYTQKIISGGIFMGEIVQDDVLQWLSANNHYAMLVNQREKPDMPGIILLNTENYLGAYKAVEVLIRYGHRRIAHIVGSMEKASSKERFAGYRDSLGQGGLVFDESIVVTANIHREQSGYEAAKNLFLNIQGSIPTAVFCANDLTAFGTIRALSELGYKVPKDVSVMGFDNVEAGKYIVPSLSTVETSVEKLADLAASNLIGCIETRTTEQSFIKLEEFSIIMRDSVADIT
ncbi:MAG: LacI family transcriptional regulator [Defluviitaleaceae bacterium]|nr:LacI family transcriptional regulator [Defluviitaleaceae bacterium]